MARPNETATILWTFVAFAVMCWAFAFADKYVFPFHGGGLFWGPTGPRKYDQDGNLSPAHFKQPNQGVRLMKRPAADG